jgi:hypothetical protein
MEQNPIYKFLKENNLTQKSEQEFIAEYADKRKSDQLAKFLQDNGLTEKTSDELYYTYFIPKDEKAKVDAVINKPAQQSVPTPTEDPNKKKVDAKPLGQLPKMQGGLSSAPLITSKFQPTQAELQSVAEEAKKITPEQQKKMAETFSQEKDFLPKTKTRQEESADARSRDAYAKIRKVLEEGKDPEEMSYIERKARSGMANLASSIYRTPEFIYDVAANSYNMLLEGQDAIIGTESGRIPSSAEIGEKTGISNVPAQKLETMTKRLQEVESKYDGSIIDFVKKGEYFNAATATAGAITESLPFTLALMIPGMQGASIPSTIAGTTLVTGAGRKQQLIEEEDALVAQISEINNDTSISAVQKQELLAPLQSELSVLQNETAKNANAIAHGLAESLEVLLGSGSWGRSIRSIAEKEGMSKAKQFTVQVFDKVLKDNPYLAPFTEGLQEGMTTYLQNLSDIVILKQDKDVMEGFYDSVVVGAVMGTGFTAVQGAGNYAAKKGREKIQKEQIQAIGIVSKNGKLLERTMEDIDEQVKEGKITEEEAIERKKRITNSVAAYNSMPSDLTEKQRLEAFPLIEEKRALEEKIEGKDPALVAVEKERIEAINNQLTEISKNKKEETTDAVQIRQAEEVVGSEQARDSEGVESEVSEQAEDTAQGEELATTEAEVTATEQATETPTIEQTQPIEQVDETKTETIDTKPIAESLKDVESTAKALEGKTENISNVFNKTTAKDVFYHSTKSSPFTEFNEQFKGSNTEYPNTGQGFFFATKDGLKNLKEANPNAFGETELPVNLNIKNPLKIDTESFFKDEKQAVVIVEYLSQEKLSPQDALSKLNEEIDLGEFADVMEDLKSSDFAEFIKERGYDAIISDMGDNNLEYIVFSPSQIQILTPQAISKFYHAAKKDGNNPELVAAVEELLGAKETPKVAETTETTEQVEQQEAAETDRVKDLRAKTKANKQAAIKAFNDKLRGGFQSGGLNALPEFINLIKAYAVDGIVSIAEIIANLKKDIPALSKTTNDTLKKQITLVRLRELQNSNNIIAIVDNGRKYGFKDSQIKELLKNKKYTPKQIEDALLFVSDVGEIMPSEFKEVKGGGIEGNVLFSRVRRAVNKLIVDAQVSKKKPKEISQAQIERENRILISRILSEPSFNERELVMKYFAAGGKISPEAIASVIKEKRPYLSDKNGAKSTDGLAEKLAEDWKADMGENFDADISKIRDEIETAILNYTTKSDAINDLIDYAKSESMVYGTQEVPFTENVANEVWEEMTEAEKKEMEDGRIAFDEYVWKNDRLRELALSTKLAQAENRADVREKALEILRNDEIFQAQTKEIQDKLIAAFDKSLGIRSGKEVSGIVADIKEQIKENKVSKKDFEGDLKDAQKALRELILSELPRGQYPNSAIRQLLNLATNTTAKNLLSQADKVFTAIEKIKQDVQNFDAKQEALKAQQRQEVTDRLNKLKDKAANNSAARKMLTEFIRENMPNAAVYSKAFADALINLTQKVTDKTIFKALQTVLDKIEGKRQELKKKVLNEMYSFASKKAKAKKDLGGKRVATTVLADDRLFFREAAKIIEANIKQDYAKAIELVQSVSDVNKMDAIAAKEQKGEKLTAEENILLSRKLALDVFGDLESLSLEEVEQLQQDFEDAYKTARQRFLAEKKKVTDEISKIHAEAKKQIEVVAPFLYGTTPSGEKVLKGENERNAERKGILESMRKLGIVKSLLDFKTKFESTIFGRDIGGLTNFISTLENLVEKLDRTNKGLNVFKKNIYDRLSRARTNELIHSEASTEVLESIAKKIFGKNANLRTVKKALRGESLEIKGLRNVKTGREYDINLNKDTALKIYAWSLNETNRQVLENQGIDTDTLNQIKAYLGEDLMSYADAVIDYLSNASYEKVNEVYSKLNNVMLGKIENYFPKQTISTEIKGNALDGGDFFSAVFSSQNESFLKERIDTTSELNLLTGGFTDLLSNHVDGVAKYLAYGIPARELNYLFQSPDVNAYLEELGVKSLLRRMTAFAINSEAFKDGNLDNKAFSKLQNAFTSIVLGFKLMQIPKQMSSFVMFAPQYETFKGKKVPILDTIMFMGSYGKNMANKLEGFKFLWDLSPDFRARVRGHLKGELAVLESGMRRNLSLSQKNTKLGDYARVFRALQASPTAIGDLAGVLGIVPILKQKIERGMSMEDAMYMAADFNNTQQSNRAMDMSPLQMNPNFATRMVTMFGSSMILMVNKSIIHFRNMRRDLASGKPPKFKDLAAFYMNYALANVAFAAMSNIYKYAQGDEEDQEEFVDTLKDALMGLSMLYWMPFVGASIKKMVAQLRGERTVASPIVDPFEKLARDYDRQIRMGKSKEIVLARMGVELYTKTDLTPFIAMKNAALGEGHPAMNIYEMLGVSKSYRPHIYDPYYDKTLPKELKELMKESPDEFESEYGFGGFSYPDYAERDRMIRDVVMEVKKDMRAMNATEEEIEEAVSNVKERIREAERKRKEAAKKK